jgi:hypothetical protein
MPLFAAFLIPMFQALFTLFAAYMTKKIAATLAALTIFISLAVTMYGAMRAISAGLYYAWPSGAIWDSFNMGLWLMLPPHFASTTSEILAADLAIALWGFNQRNVARTAGQFLT